MILERGISSSGNNKRIAKNTLMLYFRMLLSMGVSLFTVRIVLDTLGIVDYGLYNVVGSVVAMFSFFSTTMASASQRFFSYELGRKNYGQLKKIFSMTMTIYVMIAMVIFILAETAGLWFLNTQMSIPPERMEAARRVYQFSVLSFMVNMFAIPYNAVIVAHENMKVYAWVSIVEVILKLIIVYLLVLFSYDKLKLYAILMFGVTALISFFYRAYCKHNFQECRFSFYWENTMFKEIMRFSGWNLFGVIAALIKSQGINILLNIFFGPVVNAARGIAYQVDNAVNQFVTNFLTAVKPQIFKYYAEGDIRNMTNLIFRSSKFAYFLLFVLSIPVLMETRFIFGLWLKEIPEYAVLFTRLVIVNTLVDSISIPLITAALSTGKIGQYQMVVGGVMLLNLPVSFLFLKSGFPPEVTIYIGIIIALFCMYLRLVMLRRIITFSISDYSREVIMTIIPVSVAACPLPWAVTLMMEEGVTRFVFTCLAGLAATAGAVYLFGLTGRERAYVKKALDEKAFYYCRDKLFK